MPLYVDTLGKCPFMLSRANRARVYHDHGPMTYLRYTWQRKLCRARLSNAFEESTNTVLVL